jgi:hypothetical protein
MYSLFSSWSTEEFRINSSQTIITAAMSPQASVTADPARQGFASPGFARP